MDVSNTGAMAGREVVQLYVAAIDSRVSRAPQDLRAFAAVDLEPGATETVTLRVDARDLAFWEPEADAWEVEPIAYGVRLASHAEDPGLTDTFRVE